MLEETAKIIQELLSGGNIKDEETRTKLANMLEEIKRGATPSSLKFASEIAMI